MKLSKQVLLKRTWYLLLILFAGVTASLQARWLTIHNDFNQFDTDGKSIQTRSGCLCKFEEKYYWYGCDKAMTNQTCYSSTDLLHWTNHGNMLTAYRGTNRMDVIYNDSTKNYVMVLKWETPTDAWCNRGIATSNSPTGPFTKLYDSLVYGVNTGDMSVFKDDDGKAYYLYELWDNGRTSLGFSLMTWDYIGLQKKMQQWSNSDREASMMMKRRGLYYYLTSKMVGIDPSETQYFTAPKIDGPWTTRLVSIIAPGDNNRASWDTQCDFVFPFKGTEDTVQMYCGDRWVRPRPARGGDYVWLPITFSPKDSVIINYYQDWEVEPDLGIWRAIDSKRNLALNKTATASSSSGSDAPGNVTSASTWQNYTNTKWTSAATDSQWITVDLGSELEINRVILKWDSSSAKSFTIQLSNDKTTWKDVFSTTVNGPRSVTDETFEPAIARYVRMYGIQRNNSSKGYSLYDFMVLNDSLPKTAVQKKKVPFAKSIPSMSFLNNHLRYTLSSGDFVKIDIIDSRGRRVAVFANRYKSAGQHEIMLPHSLGSGMFIIRMVTGSQKITAARINL
ncbi:MAG TPA: discoidin domain-containing protein [Chitinispirillaceae bacterium]|nr:discoidin domain-containing protein [Chitinispirillaceae bacterium]